MAALDPQLTAAQAAARAAGTTLRVRVRLAAGHGAVDPAASREDLGYVAGRLLGRVSRESPPILIMLDPKRASIVIEASATVIDLLAKQPEVAAISLDRRHDLEGI